jgi:predicted O-methyltransferase YrrM
MDTGSSLVSVDVDATAQSVAARMLGGDTRLRLVLQDAGEFLRAQPAAFFDVVFADAMPGKYEGLEDALRVVAPGGLYVADDMLPQPNWPAGHAVKVAALLDELSADERFAFVPLAWSSGVIVAVRHNHP